MDHSGECTLSKTSKSWLLPGKIFLEKGWLAIPCPLARTPSPGDIGYLAELAM